MTPVRVIVLINLAFILALVGFVYWAQFWITDSNADGPMVEVSMPELSEAEARGAERYAEHCWACHGTRAAGREGVAPPLVHEIYATSRFPDSAFHDVVQNGAESNPRWDFSDMPPVSGASRADIELIVGYVRALQTANGIE